MTKPQVGERVGDYIIVSVTPILTPYRRAGQTTKVEGYTLGLKRRTTNGGNMIDISKLDKARVLKALYDHSHVAGMGFMAARTQPLTVEECRELLKTQSYFDYLHGRVMKVKIAETTCVLDPRLYDRDNGPSAAEMAILDEFTRPDTAR